MDDDGAGLLVKAKALREQAREVLVSATRCIEPPTPAAIHMGPHLLPSPARPPQRQEVRPAAKEEPAAKGRSTPSSTLLKEVGGTGAEVADSSDRARDANFSLLSYSYSLVGLSSQTSNNVQL